MLDKKKFIGNIQPAWFALLVGVFSTAFSIGIGLLIDDNFHNNYLFFAIVPACVALPISYFSFVSFKKFLAIIEKKNLELEEANLLILSSSQKIKEKNEQLSGLSSKLSKYLAPQLYDSIFTGEKEVKIETHRKKITIFFSDIVGFTSITEETDEVKLSVWLNTYLNDMANIAFEHGGTLDKFIGDAVMVFFGDPKTQGEQEDALKCVSMAMVMQDRAKFLGIDIRIGIHSGYAIVGNFGSENRMDYTVIGRAVN